MNEVIYVFKSGKISRKANTIFLETIEGEKKYIPVEATKEIHFFGQVSLNKEALELFSQKEILLHFYNYYDYYVGTFYPREHYNSGYMIVRQTQHYLDKNLRLRLARKFVQGGISNMLKVLAYYNRRGTDLQKQISYISLLYSSVEATNDIGQLMATEGKARKLYYSCFSSIISNPDFTMTTRTRRPPQNSINALISFGNSLIYTEILSQIYRTHLDPRIGYLHESNFRRFSLNLDVSEIFKPILVDRAIFSLIN
jgi:CRISPR-associated protein Cas1